MCNLAIKQNKVDRTLMTIGIDRTLGSNNFLALNDSHARLPSVLVYMCSFTIYIKYMVTVLKYQRYWARVRKRQASPSTTFSARAQISLIFQDSYHVFCLSCNFNNLTYFFLLFFNSLVP